MKITKQTIEQMLYNAGQQSMIVTDNDAGMFVKYCGNGKINYKTSLGILKTVNVFKSTVYIYNY